MWNRNHFEIDVAIIRHGKTRSNIDKKYISYTDECLVQDGINEIESNLKKNVYPPAESVYTSSKLRAIQTADIIYEKLPKYKLESFDEYNFGIFEGKTYEQMKHDKSYCDWLESNCSSEIPMGESREKFIDRTITGFYKVLKSSKDLERIAIVAHGGTVMAISSYFLSSDYYEYMTNSGGYINCHVCFDIEGAENVSVSHFSITNWYNP